MLVVKLFRIGDGNRYFGQVYLELKNKIEKGTDVLKILKVKTSSCEHKRDLFLRNGYRI